MRLSDILDYLHILAPLSFQEDYDNAGLIIGDPSGEITGALICIDVTEEILDEAIGMGYNLVISHHPLIFSALKKLTGSSLTERLVIKAIRSNLSIVAAHTNLDNVREGVNGILCEKLGILNPTVLRPLEGKLRKLVTFCPAGFAGKVRESLFAAGAGQIGNYDSCSFNLPGQGTFRALQGANPFVGRLDELHTESEIRIEVIYPAHIEKQLLKTLRDVHPYEEVAYDIYALANAYPDAGAGMIGQLQSPADPVEYLAFVKKTLQLGCLKYSTVPEGKISKIAVCGGAGSFLIRDAITAGADLFLTGDIRYHEFFLPVKSMILGDIGHYESEQFTKELVFTRLKEKFPTFALQISGISSNPIKYL